MRYAAFVFALTLVGCAATAPKEAAHVRIANASGVVGCQFIVSVQAGPSWGSFGMEARVEDATNRALAKSAQAGATHMVITGVMSSLPPIVTGDAYRCQ